MEIALRSLEHVLRQPNLHNRAEWLIGIIAIVRVNSNAGFFNQSDGPILIWTTKRITGLHKYHIRGN